MSLDRHIAHGVVDRAIDQLQDAGMEMDAKERKLLYRMGMVGIMASYVARDEAVPEFVTSALVKGKTLSDVSWRETIGGN